MLLIASKNKFQQYHKDLAETKFKKINVYPYLGETGVGKQNQRRNSKVRCKKDIYKHW